MRYAVVFAGLAALASAAPKPYGGNGGYGSCQQCNPTSGLNKCDITTSCIVFPTSNFWVKPSYCACRHGYKADYPWVSQFRTTWPGQEGRVFVPTGVSCNTLCNDPLHCYEVPVRDQCWRYSWFPSPYPYGGKGGHGGEDHGGKWGHGGEDHGEPPYDGGHGGPGGYQSPPPPYNGASAGATADATAPDASVASAPDTAPPADNSTSTDNAVPAAPAPAEDSSAPADNGSADAPADSGAPPS